MQKVQFIEVIIRLMPEQLLFILGCYALTKTPMNLKKYFTSVIIGTVLAYIIKLLPVQAGINTILGLGVLISVNIFVNGIKVAKAIQSSILFVAVLFVAEAITIVILILLGIDLNTAFENPVRKYIYGLPSLIILGIFVLAVRLINSKSKSSKTIEVTELRY